MDKRAAQLKLPPDATCLGCGYSLRALTLARCPECGREFDPASPRTYRRPPFVTPPARALRSRRPFEWDGYAQPPHALALVACVLIAVTEVWWTSWPLGESGFPSFAPCCIVWLLPAALLADYAVRIIATIGRDPTARTPRRKRRAWRWAVLPVCCILFANVRFSSWPLRARFELSRAALEQRAARALDSRQGMCGAGWIGLYAVRDIRVRRTDPPAVLFVTNETDVRDGIFTIGGLEAGFCYRPAGPGPRSIESLGGGWYVETCESLEVPD